MTWLLNFPDWSDRTRNWTVSCNTELACLRCTHASHKRFWLAGSPPGDKNADKKLAWQKGYPFSTSRWNILEMKRRGIRPPNATICLDLSWITNRTPLRDRTPKRKFVLKLCVLTYYYSAAPCLATRLITFLAKRLTTYRILSVWCSCTKSACRFFASYRPESERCATRAVYLCERRLLDTIMSG